VEQELCRLFFAAAMHCPTAYNMIPAAALASGEHHAQMMLSIF
jgi:hypothetical protein